VTSTPPPRPDPDDLPEGWDLDDISDDELERLIAETRDEAQKLIDEEAAASAASLPPPPPIVPPAGPTPQPWDQVAQAVKIDTLGWVGSARSATGRLLVLKPSPGTGKTASLILAALDEQQNRRAVAFGVAAKSQFTETRERFEQAHAGRPGHLHLHVLSGRDAENCKEFETVEAAQQSGYSPGRVVCSTCDYSPLRAVERDQICLYYKTRIEAARDHKRARAGIQPYPIILTTHHSIVHAQRLTKHKYGGFWLFDTIIFDEDPSAAFDHSIAIEQHRLVYSKPDDVHSWTTALLREAIALAEFERKSSAARLYKTINGSDDHIHSKWGSAYVSDDLHDLLRRTMLQPSFGALAAPGAVVQVEDLLGRTVTEETASLPPSGDFYKRDLSTISTAYPHRGLSKLAEALIDEMELIEQDRKHGMRSRFSYRARLEYQPEGVGTWRYVCATYVGFGQDEPNVIVGDAYAHVQHYEQIFGRRADVIDHRAKWPADVLLIRVLTHAARKDIEDAPKEFFKTNLYPMLLAEAGRKVVFYIHMRWKGQLDAWLAKNDFKLADWAIEHYGGGRGKDIYRDFDTLICASQFVPNVSGMAHEANGRAFLQSSYTDRFRVEHWTPGTTSGRRGSQTYGQSTTTMDPRLLAIHQRKSVEEQAQAVHRIRPAMPTTGPSKRVYIVGHQVALTEELLAATTTLGFDPAQSDTFDQAQHGADGVAYTIDPGADHTLGKRITLSEGMLTFVSAREMAQAIGCVYATLGCWSSAFAHSLLALTCGGDFSALQELLRNFTSAHNYVVATVLESSLYSRHDIIMEPSARGLDLLARVWTPPQEWERHSRYVQEHYAYKQALRAFSDQLPADVVRGVIRRDWMGRSRGREYIGDPRRFLAIIDRYAPNYSTVADAPF